MVSAPSPHRSTERIGLLGKLMARVRPEFRVEVYLADADDPIAKRAELIDEYTEAYCNPWEAADRGYIDDVIDPADTRIKLIAGLEMLRSKRESLPARKHGNMPL